MRHGSRQYSLISMIYIASNVIPYHSNRLVVREMA